MPVWRNVNGENFMKKTTKTPFQPTAKVRVVPRNQRTQVAPDARKRHNIKIRTNIHLDLDVINFFKQRAKAPGALPYQTQINAALRRIMEEGRSEEHTSEL